MASTQHMWIVAWRQLPVQVRHGMLTAKASQRPTAAATKHLLPTVFHGVLPASYYQVKNDVRYREAHQMSQELLSEAVRDHADKLVQLTSLSERLRAIYRKERKGRIANKTPQDLYLPVAREVFLTTGPNVSNDELASRLFSIWPRTTD